MQTLVIITDEEQQSTAINFAWQSPAIGEFVTTAIIKFDPAKKIKEIIEVVGMSKKQI